MKFIVSLLLVMALILQPLPASAQTLGASKDNTGGTKSDIQCSESKIFDASTSGSTELVPLTSAHTIYVCDFMFWANGTVSVKLTTGTGSNCGSAISGTPSTGTSGANAGLTPAFDLVAQTGIWPSIPTHGWRYSTGTSNALCINLSGAVEVQAQVWYQKRVPL